MASITERLALLVTADVDGAVRGLGKLERESARTVSKTDARLDRMAGSLTRIGAGMLTAGTLAGVGLVRAAGHASDLNEAVNVTEQIFGDLAGRAGEFAESASSIGQSERAAREAMSTFGGLLQTMGLANDESLDWSITLTRLASDLGSMFNTNPEDAVLALGAALRGESEPIRRYNVMLDDATVRQRAVELGLAATTAEVDNAAKVQARLNLIMEQTTAAQGDFERTSDGAANAQRRFAAEMENFQASLGEAVLPVLEGFLGIGNDLLSWFNDLDPATRQAVSTVALLGTGLLTVGGAASIAIGAGIKMRDNFRELNKVLQLGRGHLMALGAAGGVLALTAGAMFLLSKKGNTAGLTIGEISRRAAEAVADVDSLRASFDGLTGEISESTAEILAASVAELGLARRFQELGLVGDDLIDTFVELAAMSDAELLTGGDKSPWQEFLGLIGAVEGATADWDRALFRTVGNLRSAQVGEEILADLTGATEDATEAVEDLESAWGDLVDDILGRSDSFIDAAEFMEEVEDVAGRINDMSYAEARREVDELAAAYGATAGDILQDTGSIEAVGDFTGPARTALFNLMLQAGYSRAEIERMGGALDAIDGRVATAEVRVRIESGSIVPGTSFGGTAEERGYQSTFGAGLSPGFDFSKLPPINVNLDGQELAQSSANWADRGATGG